MELVLLEVGLNLLMLKGLVLPGIIGFVVVIGITAYLMQRAFIEPWH